MKYTFVAYLLTLSINSIAHERHKVDPHQSVDATQIQVNDIIELRIKKLWADNNDEYYDFKKKAQEFDLYITLEICIDNDSGTDSKDVCSSPLIESQRYTVKSHKTYNKGWNFYYPRSDKSKYNISGEKLNSEARKLLKKYPGGLLKYHLHLYSDHMPIFGGDQIRATKKIFGYYDNFKGEHKISGDDAKAKIEITINP